MTLRYALDLITPDRYNKHGIAVFDTEIVPSILCPPTWVEAAKTYRPDLPEYLSVLAWMLDVNDGKINVGGHFPIWSLGRVQEARALLEQAEGSSHGKL